MTSQLPTMHCESQFWTIYFYNIAEYISIDPLHFAAQQTFSESLKSDFKYLRVDFALSET